MSKSVSYVVGIPDPDSIRRNLLEGARNMITILKQKKELEEIRTQRTQKVSELRETLSELHSSLSTLRNSLPKQKNRPKVAQKKQSTKSSKKSSETATGLAAIHGLGPTRISKLHELGIKTPTDLAKASVTTVSRAGINAGTAKKLISRAQEHTGVTVDESVHQDNEEHSDLSEMKALEEKLSSIESKLKNL